MDEIKAKQQVVEKIKEASKILVTVSDSPSVDALSAALGLTLLLDKKEKYATAIFSGEIPKAIKFLEPEKTFDDTTDSLRDFIIALNKEKADHLRYKVEGDSVKIFITPYKTVISRDDLEFSQGDYNIELVIALGVDNQDHLDAALDNHGKILHDASIVTLSAGDQVSNLGGIDWHDANASSLSEMVAGLAEALKDDKKASLVDAPVATALLTGIVAQTDRFSNEHTTSKAMTVAATLMAAGADQQLIANELQASNEPSVDESGEAPSEGGPQEDVGDNTALSITHPGETLADLDRRLRGEEKAAEKIAEERKALESEEIRDVQASNVNIPGTSEPVLGGTLNATADQAAEDARREAENDQNKTILSHAYIGASDPVNPGAVGVNAMPTSEGEQLHSVYAPSDEELASSLVEPEAPGSVSSPEPTIQPPTVPSSASESAPAAPAGPTPADLGLPLPPPVPDFSQVNGITAPQPPAIPLPPTEPPAILGDILAPEPAAPEAPSVAPETAQPSVEPASAYAPSASETPAVEPASMLEQPSSDPGQFQIPTSQQ